MNSPDVPEFSGKIIGSYLLEEEVGRGGMGSVYRARRIDGEFDQTVAIKLIKRGTDTDSVLKRFRRERQILASLDHPNIAYFLGGGSTESGLPYFVMEFIHGKPLYTYCDEHKLDIKERLKIFRQLCWAVTAAHTSNILHRDLKPSNILVNAEGKPKLLDFGIGKLLDPDDIADSTDSTAIHSRIMTPEYASPEQVSGEEIGVGTDIYSLGVILYELLTGHRPYVIEKKDRLDAGNIVKEQIPANPSLVITEQDGIIFSHSNTATVEQIVESRNTTVNDLIKQLSGDLDRIVQKCLRKNISARYKTVQQLSEDIDNYLEGKPVNAEFITTLGGYSAKAVSSKLSLAILPLRVLNTTADDDSDEFVGVGFSDALISRLSGFGQLIVRPTTSILRFSKTDAFEAGKALDVDYVIDGSVRIYNGRIRLSIQLLDIASRSTRWARAFDEDTGDVLELEDTLSEQITRTLLPHLSSEEKLKLKRRSTNDPEAYEAYIRGRYFWSHFNDQDLKRAVKEFEEAIRVDPEYTLPYIGLADYYTWSAIFGEMPSIEGFTKAEEAARTALQIDDRSAEAYAALGFIRLIYGWNWEDAEYLAKKAIELDPNYSFGHECYSNFLCAQGRFDEAVEEIRIAESLERYSPRSLLMTSWTLYQARRYHEAVNSARRAYQTHPDLPQVLLHLGNCLTADGQYEEAIEMLRRSSELWGNAGMPRHMLAMARAKQGDKNAVEKILAKMLEVSETIYVKPYYIAMCYLAADDIDKAYEWFSRSVAERNEWMIWFGVDPKLDALRNDPRYLELLKATRNPLAERDPRHNTLEPITGGNVRSIAVLPFKLIGSDEIISNNKYLAVGLADAVTIRLSNIRRFLVRPTSSTLKYANSQIDSFEIGRMLGADLVIDGIIRQINDKIVVTAQLLSVNDGSVRWSSTFQEASADILDLEDKISSQVAREIIPKLSSDEINQLQRQSTRSASAYEAYLQGRYFWNQFTEESFPKAMERYQRAITIDPNFAEAHAAVSDLFAWASIYGLDRPKDNIHKIHASAIKALEINPDLSEAHAALGLYHSNMQEWIKAEECYHTALDLNPNNALAHEWFSALLVGGGKTAEGITSLQTAETLDPMSLRPKILSAWTYYQAHDFERSLAKSKELITFDENSMQSHLHYGNALFALGDHETALQHTTLAFEMAPGSPLPLHTHCFALVANGLIDDAIKHIEKWEMVRSTKYVPAYFLALSYLAVNEVDKALTYLDIAREERSPWTIWFCSEPKLEIIRSHPLFKQMLVKMNGPKLSN